MAKDIKTKERFVELRAQGLSYAKIAQELGVSKPTLIKWSQELHEDINNLKVIEMEALLEKHYVLRRARIELLGEQLEAVKEELATRDLGDLSTSGLFNLLLKLSDTLKREDTGGFYFEGEKKPYDPMEEFVTRETWAA